MKRPVAALLALLGFLLCGLAPAEAAARFAVCTATCTWDGSSTVMWSATTGGATGASVPGTADTVTLDANTCVGGVTCTITVNTNASVSSLTMGACTASTTGCILDFSVNNNNFTSANGGTGFSLTGTGTRTLRMGSGTFNLGSTGGSFWNAGTTTNLTFTVGTSTIIGNTSSGFSGGGLTYNVVNFAAAANTGVVAISGANTFATVGITAPIRINFPIGVTNTITNAFAWTSSSSSPFLIYSSTVGTTATISVATGAPTMSWAAIMDITFTGGASFTATNSFNEGHNTGISITAPSGGGGEFVGIIGGM